jgi:hypothetical protein
MRCSLCLDEFPVCSKCSDCGEPFCPTHGSSDGQLCNHCLSDAYPYAMVPFEQMSLEAARLMYQNVEPQAWGRRIGPVL